MTVRRTTRSLAVVLGLACLALAAPAQRGGPPGGGAPGGMGGRMDAPPPRNGMMDRGASPVNTPSPLRVGPQLGLPGRWWDDKKTVKHLGLRTDQQRRMDDIFNSNKGTLVGLLSNLQREQTRLSSLSPQELQDEAKVFAAIDRVEVARAELEKENARILMQIRQQLDPTQLSVLDQDIASFR